MNADRERVATLLNQFKQAIQGWERTQRAEFLTRESDARNDLLSLLADAEPVGEVVLGFITAETVQGDNRIFTIQTKPTGFGDDVPVVITYAEEVRDGEPTPEQEREHRDKNGFLVRVHEVEYCIDPDCIHHGGTGWCGRHPRYHDAILGRKEG